jgi:hypothetical protein
VKSRVVRGGKVGVRSGELGVARDKVGVRRGKVGVWRTGGLGSWGAAVRGGALGVRSCKSGVRVKGIESDVGPACGWQAESKMAARRIVMRMGRMDYGKGWRPGKPPFIG